MRAAIVIVPAAAFAHHRCLLDRRGCWGVVGDVLFSGILEGPPSAVSQPILNGDAHFAACVDIYKIDKILHRSEFKITVLLRKCSVNFRGYFLLCGKFSDSCWKSVHFVEISRQLERFCKTGWKKG